MNRSLADVDPEVAEAIFQETRRQSETIELIASENFVGEAIYEEKRRTGKQYSVVVRTKGDEKLSTITVPKI